METAEIKALTVSEALAQGYVHYVYNEDGYQSLKHISDVDDINWSKKPVIVSKEALHPSGIDAKELAEMIADQIECQYADDTGCDDTSDVYEAIKALDFSDMENKIAEALSGINFYRATDIQLFPPEIRNPVPGSLPSNP